MSNEQLLSSEFRFDKIITSGRFWQVGIAKQNSVVVMKIDLSKIKELLDKVKLVDIVDIIEKKGSMMLFLEDKNIARTIACFRETSSEGDLFFIVTEYCGSASLSSIMRRESLENKCLPEIKIRNWMKQVAAGLYYIHERNVVHGNLNPKSIVLSKGETVVKLCDFGFEKLKNALGQQHYTTLMDDKSGRYADCFHSPEYMDGKPFSAKCDVWSLGVVLFYLATLEVANTAILNLGAVSERYSSELRSLLSDILVPDPNIRPTIKQISDHCFLEQPYVVLIGPVGSGKTTLLQKLLDNGRQLRTNDFGESISRQSTLYRIPFFDVVDTPGYQSMEHKIDHAMHIAKALTYKPVSRIFVLCSFENRLDRMLYNLKAVISHLCSELEQYLTIVVTHWDYTEDFSQARMTEVETQIREALREHFQITSALFIGKNSLNIVQLFLDVVGDATLGNKTKASVSIGVDNLSRYFDLERSDVVVSRIRRDLLADFELLTISALRYSDNIKNDFEKQDFIFSVQGQLEKHILDTREQFIAKGGLNELEPEDYYCIRYFTENLCETFNKYAAHAQQVRTFLSGSVDKESPFRVCPYCGLIWTKVNDCDGPTVCGAVPSVFDIDGKPRQLRSWAWERYEEHRSYRFTYQEGPIINAPERKAEHWISLVKGIEEESFQIVFKYLFEGNGEILATDSVKGVAAIFNKFVDMEEGYSPTNYSELFRILKFLLYMKISEMDSANKVDDDVFRQCQVCLYRFLQGQLTILEAVAKVRDLSAIMPTPENFAQRLKTNLNNLPNCSDELLAKQAFKAIEKMAIKIPVQRRNIGCGNRLKWNEMASVPIPSGLFDSNCDITVESIVPGEANLRKKIIDKLTEKWNQVQLIVDDS